ncbi:regulator of microtubule dynamics protein 1-like [Thrips palmi]|uniref:Regulator of microtubule dynamics protein 1 n=1 Tax=Thrips palmi TaxID=161013 RepID=A0A6P8ZAM4_THRPL|nr:regulator of microtubule dynamics protein 1-like [Thrips palmi]
MLSRVRFISSVLSHIRVERVNYLARPLGVVVKALPAIRFTKPLALCSGTLVVYAASPDTKQITLPSLKDVAVVVKKADILFEENKLQDILDLLRPYKHLNNEEISWRISRASYLLSKSKTLTKAERDALIEESYDMAKMTLQLNENSALGHKWMSIALDAYNAIQGFRTRCTSLVSVKDHMLKSIELDPSDATVIYMVGMWYYSIAELAWYQRKVLQAIAGKPPSATYEEALHFFKKAEETSPNFYSLNLLMLGKCHLKLGDPDTAIDYLQRAMNYPKFTEDDHQAHQEASELLKSLKTR